MDTETDPFARTQPVPPKNPPVDETDGVTTVEPEPLVPEEAPVASEPALAETWQQRWKELAAQAVELLIEKFGHDGSAHARALQEIQMAAHAEGAEQRARFLPGSPRPTKEE